MPRRVRACPAFATDSLSGERMPIKLSIDNLTLTLYSGGHGLSRPKHPKKEVDCDQACRGARMAHRSAWFARVGKDVLPEQAGRMSLR